MKIVIPTIHAQPLLLVRCVATVRATTGIDPTIVDGGTFAENCNQGATGPGPYVFLNDDTEPAAGWFTPLVDALNDPTIGIAGSRLLYPDGRIQHGGIGFRDRGGLEAFNIIDDLPTRDVPAVTGACLAIRADVFHELGGFNTEYRNGYEDVDLCLRAAEAGYRIRYVAESTVVHHESQSGPARWAHAQDNIALLQTRWSSWQS